MPGTTVAMRSPREPPLSASRLAIWGGPGWESADDWAALVASLIIAANGIRFLGRRRQRSDGSFARCGGDRNGRHAAAHSVEGVLATEKVRVRKFGVDFLVDLHVQADPTLSLHAAHILSGKVKYAIQQALPTAKEVLDSHGAV